MLMLCIRCMLMLPFLQIKADCFTGCTRSSHAIFLCIYISICNNSFQAIDQLEACCLWHALKNRLSSQGMPYPVMMSSVVLQAYVHNMGRLLLDNSDRGTDTEQPLIQMLTEAACLYCCISAYNVDTLKAALASRLDTGLPSDRHLGHAFYTQFLVSSLRLTLTEHHHHCSVYNQSGLC